VITIAPYDSSFAQDISRVEQGCFPSPWSMESLLRTLSGENALTLTALDEGTPVGYASALLIGEEAEVLKVAVLPEWRGRGVGRQLAEALIEGLGAAGVRTLHLEVRESNRAARILYEKCGFRHAGRRSGYYSSPREDAVLLTMRMG